MQTKEIKAKIGSIGNIKKITRTMEMVSVAKMRKATASSLLSANYSKHAKEILESIISEPDQKISSPYLDSNDKATDELLVIISSNKGLCGGYNNNISKKVQSYLKNKSDIKFKVITIGKYSEKIARRNSLEVVASFTDFRDFFSIEDALGIRKIILDLYKENNIKTVKLFFTNFIKSLNYETKIEQVLPLDLNSLQIVENTSSEKNQKNTTPKSMYLFEPSLTEIIENIVPGIITTIIYQALLDSSASEHSSRMVAMKGATENAGNLLSDLQLSYNKARQEGITREISEIVAGGESNNQDN